jgi:hypothetical protein
MRSVLLATIAAALVPLAACNGGAAAAGQGQFDLTCKGQMTRDGAAEAFDTRLHIDLGANRFCFDSCLTMMGLTQSSDAALAFHYDVNHPNSAGRPVDQGNAPISSAGPWTQADDIAVDRRTGAYHRTLRYDAGDPAARAYTEVYAGQCQVMPFTGLAARAG